MPDEPVARVVIGVVIASDAREMLTALQDNVQQPLARRRHQRPRQVLRVTAG